MKNIIKSHEFDFEYCAGTLLNLSAFLWQIIYLCLLKIKACQWSDEV